MGIQFEREKCIQCNPTGESFCSKYCPGDLIYLDSEEKPQMRDNSKCWDCMVCVKACPVEAIYTVLPYSISSSKAKLIPFKQENKIIWKLEKENEIKEEFEIITAKDEQKSD